ncbi:MAG: hypothetical protein ABTR07_09115 [Candidatus Competibacter denitrificans]
MIALASPTCDPNGYVVLPTRPLNPYDTERRGTITATLDGGVSVYDAGYSLSDQTLRAEIKRPEKALLLTLRYLISHYAQLVMHCETGCYMAVVSMSMNRETLSLTFRLIRRLDA